LLVEIELRRRNNPPENIITELMILMNSNTAEFLASSVCPAVYRTQRQDMPELGRGRPRADLTVNPREHGGIGASLYCWATSPLRRYADLINQRQMASLLGGPLPAYRNESELLIRAKKAEFLNQASLNHQRRMERYWVLKYLEQNRDRAHAVNLHTKGRSILAAFEDIPLHLNLTKDEVPFLAGAAHFYPESFDFYALEVRGRFMPVKG
jgi:exoribonuclease-2